MPDRASDASRLRGLVERLCAVGFDVVVITGTHVGNVDGQLRARPAGPGRLLLCVNRGSEVFDCGRDGPTLVQHREASAEENDQLDRAAALTVERLGERGLHAEIVAQRLNRRKVDIIPLPQWADPPKARIGELLAAVEERLHAAGIASVADVVSMAEAASTEAGLPNARISSDAKYVEIGLTDKADAARWTFADLWEHGITAADVLVAGDEFGMLGGVPGSDSLILVPESDGALAVTVGREPFGAPPGVLALPGGPDRMLEVLEDQLQRRLAGEPPVPRPAVGWSVTIDGFDENREAERASVLTVADGRIGSIGVPVLSHPAASPVTLAAGFYDGDGAAEHLRPLPGWNQLAAPLASSPRLCRTLDLRTGVLAQEVEQDGGRLSALGFSALHDPGTAALWLAGDPALLGTHDGEQRHRHHDIAERPHGNACERRAPPQRRRDGARTHCRVRARRDERGAVPRRGSRNAWRQRATPRPSRGVGGAMA